MEQIHNAMLEMLKRSAGSQLSSGSGKLSVQTKRDEFGMLVKLAEQKNSESVSNQTGPETQETTDSKTSEATDNAKETTEKSEKPEQEETEVCDVAREVACAQIVWLVPQEETETVAVATDVIEGVTENMEAAAMQTVPGNEETVVLPEELPLEETGDGAAMTVSAETEMSELPSKPVTADTPETAVDAWKNVEAAQTAERGERAEAEIAVQPEAAQVQETDIPDVRVDNDEETNGEAVVETAVFKDVEAAPIKVADAPAQTEEAELKEQVSDHLVKVLESGEDRVEIQLQPEALGKLTVALTRSADGTLSVVLHAENSQTRSLLEKSMGSLQELLVDRGQQNVQVSVERNEEAQQQQNQQQDLQDGSSGNRQQQRRHQESSSEDFLQQLRLGLIDFDEEE